MQPLPDTNNRNSVPERAASPELAAFIHRLSKAELHLHLEGSIQPETLQELSIRKSRQHDKVANWIADRRRDAFRYSSFQAFLQAFGLISLLLESPEDYGLITARLLEALATQNVIYAEVTLSIGVVLWKNQCVQAVFEAIREAGIDTGRRVGVMVKWIFDAVRQFGVEHAKTVLGWAQRYAEDGVVAFGIGGDEVRGPAELFTEVYREARDCGLHVTAHAGEAAGPESIRNAVEMLGAARIGHGLTAWQDPALMALLRERRIALEVCPTSNVCTGLVTSFQDHPFPRLLDAGLLLTLNSDDPGMFGTTLEREFELAATHFGLSRDTIVRLCQNAIEAAFLEPEEQARLLQELHNTST